MRVAASLGSWIVLLGAVGCDHGGGMGLEGHVDAMQICSAVEACDFQLAQDCRDLLDLIRPTAECGTAIETATCEEHEANPPGWFDVCFPPCDVEGMTCNPDDTLTSCGGLEGTLREITIDCESVCRQEGFAYYGGCGDSFVNQMSQSGDVCWCVE